VNRLAAVLAGSCVLLLSGAPSARAAGQFWSGADGGYRTYGMSDINRDIRHLNTATGLEVNEIGGGRAGGIEVGVTLTSRLSLAAGYERLTASAVLGDSSGSVTYDLPANLVFGSVEYTAPSSTAFHLGLAAGLGLVSAAGKIEVNAFGADSSSGKVTGTGLMLQARVLGEYRVTHQIVLVPNVGFRLAKIGRQRLNGRTMYNADGSREVLDYSGFVIDFAVRFLLNDGR
jgi:hypothetical protein